DSTAENPAASPDTTTWYYLTVTSSWGCESPLDSVLVWLKPTPVAEAGPNLQMCAGDTVDLLGSYYYTTTDSANPSEIYYAWTPNQFISDSTAPQPQAWPDGSQWYYLDVRHNTCETRDSVFVTFNPELGGWVEADTTTICGGDSVQLYSGGGLGGMLYQWSPTDGLSDPNIANPIAAPSDSTTYQLVLLEGGCTDTLSIDMNVIPRPEMAYLSSATTGCAPFTVNFLDDSDTPIQYIWNFGDGSPVVNTQHPTHTYEAPGNYTVSLTGVNLGGCDATASDIVVNVTDPAAAAFITNPEFPATLPLPAGTVAFTDQSFNAMSWLWDFGDGTKIETQNPVHLYTSPGEYFATLTVLTAEGCRSMITHGPFTVYAPDLFIPNVFSPNDDDVNDGFLVGYSGSQPFFMEIFDRWGVRHFQTRNKLQPWRGQTEDGAEVPEGVYYYHVTVGDQEYAGPVTLVR
ncbi:MAG: PKD domain-containing protein, partial [Bacteroidota bacterium]